MRYSWVLVAAFLVTSANAQCGGTAGTSKYIDDTHTKLVVLMMTGSNGYICYYSF